MKTVYLLGAGASKGVGLPTSVELLHSVRSAWQTLSDRALRDALDAVDSSVRAVHGNPNFEHLLTAATAIAMRKDSELFKYTKGLTDPFRSLARKDPNILDEIHLLLIDMMRDHLIPEDSRAFLSPYLKQLVRMAMTSHDKAIFTLNYDRSIETVLEAEAIPYATGFRAPTEDEAVYLDATLEYWPVRHQMDQLQRKYEQVRRIIGSGADPFDFAVDGSQAQIQLVKVHGSLGWYRVASNPMFFEGNKVSPEDRIVNLKDNVPERGLPMIIAGVFGKERLEEPFVTLLRKLYLALLNADIVVTIGYSFSDKHINDLLLRVLLRERTLGFDIVVVNGSKWPKDEKGHGAPLSQEASFAWPMLCRAGQQNMKNLGLAGVVVVPFYAQEAIMCGHLETALTTVGEKRTDRLHGHN